MAGGRLTLPQGEIARAGIADPTKTALADNTNRTPSATRPTLVRVGIRWNSSSGGDETEYAVSVGAVSFDGPALTRPAGTVGTINMRHGISFLVPANTAYKIAKADLTGTPTTVYEAVETTL